MRTKPAAATRPAAPMESARSRVTPAVSARQGLSTSGALRALTSGWVKLHDGARESGRPKSRALSYPTGCESPRPTCQGRQSAAG
jgi:hypothetical protein